MKYAELYDLFKVEVVNIKPETFKVWEQAAQEQKQSYALKGEILSAQKRLVAEAHEWNEQELKMYFVAPLLTHLRTKQFFFYERRFSIEVPQENEEEIKRITCKPDFILANRFMDKNECPTALIGEIKPSQSPDYQLMKAMAIVKQSEKSEVFILGCSILSNQIKFSILYENQCYISRAYDACDAEEFRLICCFLLTADAMFN